MKMENILVNIANKVIFMDKNNLFTNNENNLRKLIN